MRCHHEMSSLDVIMRCQHKKAITTAMHTGGCRGNLIVRLKVKGHPKLQRIGSTISSCINIPWAYLPAREGITCCHCCTFLCCVLSSILTYSSLAKIGLGLLWLPAACPESACWCNAHHAVQAYTACMRQLQNSHVQMGHVAGHATKIFVMKKHNQRISRRANLAVFGDCYSSRGSSLIGKTFSVVSCATICVTGYSSQMDRRCSYITRCQEDYCSLP